ncbi:unnamed protein product [Cochlearia groenlandica]
MDSIDTTETLNAPPNLQIWNNAAFDDGDSNAVSAVEKPPSSWSNEISLDFISNESFDSECSKENQIPLSMSSSLKSSLSFSAADSIISGEENPPKSKSVKFRSVADQIERDIDAEIDGLEKEICRLSKRLESLKSEKAEQTAARSVAAAVAIRGRIVPSKFMESQKPSDSSLTASKSRSAAAARRGVSLGPGEIYSSSAAAASTVTPLKSAQNRRKSCFFKLPNIEEEGKVTTKARGRASLSLSPRSRKAKITTRQAAATATAGSKRATKKEESVLSSIQPKKLFKEDDKNIASSSSRKPLKQGRVVASRYSLAGKTQTAEKEARKRSLPENNEEKENHHQRSEKRRASDEDCKSQGRVKKRWEIPSEVDLYEKTPIGKELPKIRTLRRRAGGDSPRDSGAAKRVAELESKNRSFTFCQLLKFEE